MKQIAAALLIAKRAFGPALKTKFNPGFKSNYADLAACFEAVDQACLAAGIVLYQETFDVESGVTVETVFLHESGEFLRCGKLHVPAAKQDPQGYGSALSYVRRYSLMTACGIAAEDDDGNAASKPSQQPAKPAAQDDGHPATARRIAEGVKTGDAPGAAQFMADMPRARLDAVWVLLDAATQDKLTAAWPKAA